MMDQSVAAAGEDRQPTQCDQGSRCFILINAKPAPPQSRLLSFRPYNLLTDSIWHTEAVQCCILLYGNLHGAVYILRLFLEQSRRNYPFHAVKFAHTRLVIKSRTAAIRQKLSALHVSHATAVQRHFEDYLQNARHARSISGNRHPPERTSQY
jgi:hypothetical protein